MRIEIPVCTRCCFCLPVRYGLVAWGYFNLFAGCVLTIGSAIVINIMRQLSENDHQKLTPRFKLSAYIVLIVGIAQIMLSIIFIIGCHKKNLKLLKIFYYYNIVLMGVTSILCLCVSISTLITSVVEIGEWPVYHLAYFPLVEIGLFVSNFAFQVYILLILRSEIKKLSNDCKFRFTNIGGEAECTLTNENLCKEDIVQNTEINKNTANLPEGPR